MRTNRAFGLGIEFEGHHGDESSFFDSVLNLKDSMGTNRAFGLGVEFEGHHGDESSFFTRC